ncbi:polysaccharide deacetylase family protein [Edaphobacter paludis]|uniref:Polysaccharide deacetylase family protein n=1 Tax=Edaphobacter paludis TaxID=3035702 RepID=A0AAU7D706_9BACT
MRRTLRSLHLLYHELRPISSDYSYVVATSAFEEHLNLFRQIRETEGCSLRPEITFDDGHISNLEYGMPLLQSRGFIAQFFITVGWTGQKKGYMDWQELRELHGSGQMIGAHGWSHTLLTHCSKDELDGELRRSRLTLEDKLGTSITTMSLPGGRYNRRVLAACEEAGYTEVYTSIPRAEQTPHGSIIGRLNIRGDMKRDWIASALRPESGVLSRLGQQYRIKTTAQALLGDSLYGKLWSLVNRQESDSDAGATQ